jgi:hypothetical protein
MAQTNLHQAIDALGAKQVGNEYMARCPAHEDKIPSLALREGDGGTLLFHCFAGCSQDTVLDSLRKLGVFGAESTRSGFSRKRPPGKRNVQTIPRSEVLEYHRNLSLEDRQDLKSHRMLSDSVIDRYQLGKIADRISIPIYDASGEVLDIRKWLPEKSRVSNNTPKILHYKAGFGAPRYYPIDQLNSTSLLLVEGELDALAAISHGLEAVTVTAGASTWTTELSQTLKGKRITILMDHDEAGIAGARRRAESISQMGCEVHIACWPSDRPKGHDTTDELRTYGSDSLKAVIESAERFISLEKPIEPELTCLFDVEIKDVDWLWKPYLPLGKLSMIEGDPGLGKSWATLAIATHVTHGMGIPGLDPTDPANVLLVSCEDGLGDTIKPRLVNLGADDRRIFAPNKVFTLDEPGLEYLERQVVSIAPRLIIIDPLVAYMGSKVDLHRANETREVLSKLAALAEKHRCCILMVRHLTKGGQDKAIYRGMGSIDLTGACRSVILVGCDPDNRKVRALIHTKCNLAELGHAQGYEVHDSKFTWSGESELTAGKVLSAESTRASSSAVEEAEEFLLAFLEAGERAQSEIDQAAGDAGISRATLNRAKKNLKIRPRREGIKGEGRGKALWFWALPGGDHASDLFDGEES